MRSHLILSEKGFTTVGRFHCPTRRINTTLSFIIDTGAEVSLLGWQDLVRAGANVEELPGTPRPLAGFGGEATDVRHIKDPCFVYLDFEGKLEYVELSEGILVYRPSRTKTKRWKLEGTVNILGRDFLAKSGWTLVINMAQREAYLEKP